MKRIWMGLIVALTLTLTATLAQAQDDGAGQACTQDKNTRASTMIEEALDEWKSSEAGQNFEARHERGEIVLVFSDSAPVAGVITESNYGRQRILAFDKAMLDAQAKFVMQRSEKIETKKYSLLVGDEPSQAQLQFEENKVGYWERLEEKMKLLAESKLDSALREEGVDVETIQKTEPTKKIELYKNVMGRNTQRTAMGEISGLLAIENFEAVNCADGTSAVAVVAVFSQKNHALAKDIVAGRPIQADPARAADKTLSAMVREEIKSKDILNTYGTRVLHDMEGFPVIVSYGQWAFLDQGGSSYERARTLAVNMAESNAKSELALFLNGTLAFADNSANEGKEAITATITRNSQTPKDIRDVIQSQLRKSTANAKVSLTGMREIGSWTINHPDYPSLVLVGKVVMWSPRSADSIHKATGSSRRQSAALPGEQAQPTSIPNSKVTKSKSKNNAYDF